MSTVPINLMLSQSVRASQLFTVAILLVSLITTSFAKPKDFLGWEKSRWGMSEEEIIGKFGSRLQKLSKREEFLKWHTGYIIPVELLAEKFTVFFQIGNETNKLNQVLVRLNEMKSRMPREELFNLLASSMTQEYGEPSAKTSERYKFKTRYSGIELSQTWRFPTTTIELAYDWDDQIFASMLTVRYFPTH